MDPKDLKISLDRDVFLRSLVRSLSGVLEEVVGLKEASGFVSVVAQEMGAEINNAYCKELQVERLSRDQVARVCVDLKRRIEGDFYVIEESEERIVFGNRRCPFAEKVLGRPSMCMMTSNVFGHVAAQNLGYAKVELIETIAKGDAECRITVYLKPTESSADAREYFQVDRSGD